MPINSQKIDVHHHIVPKEYLADLASVGIKNAVGEPFPQWDIENTLAFMDRQGIAIAINSISAPGIYFGDNDFTQKLARKCNEISARMVKEHPNRFGAFAILPLPDIEASIVELEYALDTLKMDGVVLLTNFRGIYIGDVHYDDLFYKLNRRKAVVFVHPSVPPLDTLPMIIKPAVLEFVFDTTRAIVNLIHRGATKRFPDISFIFSHGGGTVPFITWRITFGNKKIINQLKRFYYDTAVSATPYTLSSLLSLVEPTQVLYGSDYPFLPERVVKLMNEGLQNYNFERETFMKIVQQNAVSLFPRFKEILF
ncbi:MAG: amidohydrolase [Candidatus Lokiarchaeota archaeon]|nr:amidohydrolase [Candidatus Lokiarchaeota archaeon]